MWCFCILHGESVFFSVTMTTLLLFFPWHVWVVECPVSLSCLVFMVFMVFTFHFAFIVYVTSTAAGAKCLRRGVKEVVKALRKGEKGYVLSALHAATEPSYTHANVV